MADKSKDPVAIDALVVRQIEEWRARAWLADAGYRPKMPRAPRSSG